MTIPLPFELDLETVGSCNRTCPTCLRNSYPGRDAVAGRFGKQEAMPEALFRKVIDDAAAWGFTGWLNMQHFNEPFQDVRLARLLAYAKERGTFGRVMFHSNGDLITKRKAAEVDGIADTIRIALYDEAGGQPMPEPQRSERMAEIASWFTRTQLEWTDGLHIVTHYSPYVNLAETIAIARPQPCRREVQLRQIINYRGEMLLCCEDPTSAGLWDLGNVADRTLEELWYSERHVAIVETLAEPGGREAFGYCRICPKPEIEW